MREVLDDLDEMPPQRDGYARLAFGIALITMSLLAYLLLLTPVQMQMSQAVPQPSQVVVVLTQVFCLLGVVLSIASAQRREPMSWYKVVGTILNCLWLVLVIALALFAQMMDYT